MIKVGNFRDFGGQLTAGGDRIVAGRLFRSGQAGAIGATPFETLVSCSFALVIDLRFPDEALAAPFNWPGTQAPRVVILENAGQGDAPHHAFFIVPLADTASVDSIYERFYSAIPSDPRYQSLVARALVAIVETEGTILVHCSAGKDRTGLFCALLLHLCGVGRQEIVRDYLLSNDADAKAALLPEMVRRFGRFGRKLPDEAIVDAILGVTPAYLIAAHRAIIREWGSIAGWLDMIGIDAVMRRQIRERLRG